MNNIMIALKETCYRVNALHAAINMMSWDEHTYMPPGAADARAEHLGILSRMAHEALVNEEAQRLVEEAKKEVTPGTEEEALIRVIERSLAKNLKLPGEFVQEKSKNCSKSRKIWAKARKENDFKIFEEALKKTFDFARKEADYLGYKDHLYDPLLDYYEEGATASEVASMFKELSGPQKSLIDQIRECQNIDSKILYEPYDEAKVTQFIIDTISKIGFNIENGRLDKSLHPFCESISTKDVRLTTRFISDISSAITAGMHEAGHGVYEQGSSVHFDRTPLAGGISLGVHESQSRLWENIIGRSRSFWNYFFPRLQEAVPSLAGYSAEDWYRAINRVEPSLIRIEADELTYNMHVMLRFELECAILTDQLQVKDLPEAWNTKMKDYLGVVPDSDANGCMQDMHWSEGLIGYFPTYSIGNLLSYQVWRVMERDIPNPNELMEKGNFQPILSWLQENIYQYGSRYTPKELIQRSTGKALSAQDYIEGLNHKYSSLYGLRDGQRKDQQC